MAFSVITDGFRVNQVEQVLESFSETDKTFYYMFFGRHIPWPNGVVPDLDLSKKSLDLDTYQNMEFAKRIMPSDVAQAIRRIEWAPNTVYTEYDHRIANLSSTQFYVGVTEGSNYNVFKCLYNNAGAPSTVAPSFAAFSAIEASDGETYDGYYETSDGYQWKYMFTVSDVDLAKFGTSRFVPLVANTVVSDFAVAGAIDVVKVEGSGAGYNNFFYGEFSSNSDISYLGNNTYYALRTSNNVSPSGVNDYYNGCILKIIAGRGAGQFREIVDYVNSGTVRYAILKGSFTITPDTTSKFEITPKVDVQGSFEEPAVGRAIMGSGNSIAKVEILDRGRGYYSASAVIHQSNVAVASNNAVLTAIMPPKGGHGFSAAEELGARWVSVSVKVTGDENGFIPTGQKFSQVGILKNPLFANLEITTQKFSNTAQPGRDGSFLEGETILQFKPVLQAGAVSVEVGNNRVVSTNTQILALNTLTYPHGRVFIKGANAADWFVSKIVSANASTLTLEDNCIFTVNNATVHISHSNTTATHLNSGPFGSYVTNATPFFAANDTVIGLTTYSTAFVQTIQINNKTINDFSVINQLDVISMDDIVGSFSEDEFLSSGDGSSCYFHSYANASHMYVTNMIGNMAPGTTLTNINASASISVADKYDGQILQESGSVMYLENHAPVSRDTSVSQTKKIILEF